MDNDKCISSEENVIVEAVSVDRMVPLSDNRWVVVFEVVVV